MVLMLLSAASAWGAAPPVRPEAWTARWISVPDAPPRDYGVYHFRKRFDLATRPASFVVHVSADNRYQLYVNGRRVSWGPAAGDLFHWRYETVDLAPYLQPGRNVLAAVVWNYAGLAPQSQITDETGFLLQGHSEAERAVDTGRGWKCARNPAYSPVELPRKELPYYFAIGPGDRIDGARYPWGWERPAFDDSGWAAAREGYLAAPREGRDAHSRYMLVPRPIPAMEETAQRFAAVRQAEGVRPPADFPARAAPLEIPARSRARLLLDQRRLTTAFPELVLSGGKGASVTLRYAEALWMPNRRDKGHRDEIEGKLMLGYSDQFVSGGGRQRLYRPLWWRTFRYVEVAVETAAEPLVLDDVRSVYTGYPFERRARFEGGDEELARILDVGWHTARLCAHETYMDCPYYEQLQYAGDTRIQALVSLYMSGDARLMRNAIEQIDSTRTAEGATYSRGPSRLQQYIPPFSLWWIGMVHDYWRYVDDPAFVRQMIPGTRAVVAFFEAHRQANGSLGKLPWWNFVDWTRQWRHGVPPESEEGSSAPRDLQLLLAYGWAAEMESALGIPALAAEYRKSEARLRQTIRDLYWDSGRRLFADTPARRDFSQHTNALAVLARVVEGDAARDLVSRILDDPSLVQCSIYFRYYLHSAVLRAGLGDRYLDLLGQWRTMFSRGLTTWAEQLDPTRSDCHAWGSSPNYEVFRTILGIDSAGQGFSRVVVRPHLGKLERVAGAIPHPRGEVAVSLTVRGDRLDAEIVLPPGVEGELVWRGTTRNLSGGMNRLTL